LNNFVTFFFCVAKHRCSYHCHRFWKKMEPVRKFREGERVYYRGNSSSSSADRQHLTGEVVKLGTRMHNGRKINTIHVKFDGEPEGKVASQLAESGFVPQAAVRLNVCFCGSCGASLMWAIYRKGFSTASSSLNNLSSAARRTSVTHQSTGVVGRPKGCCPVPAATDCQKMDHLLQAVGALVLPPVTEGWQLPGLV
jgi:hypothetical protein